MPVFNVILLLQQLTFDVNLDSAFALEKIMKIY